MNNGGIFLNQTNALPPQMVTGDLRDLMQGSANQTSCTATELQANMSFTPGLPTIFDRSQVAWMIDNVICAYQQYCRGTKALQKDVDASTMTQLSWHPTSTPFTATSNELCGYIAQIKPVTSSSCSSVNRILIAIRGTETPWEWITDATCEQVPVQVSIGSGAVPAPAPTATVNGPISTCNIHKGFWGIYTTSVKGGSSLQAQLRSELAKRLVTTPGVKNEIYIAGHSLGAGISTLLTLDIAAYCSTADIFSYAFASPRVGDKAFAQLMGGMAKDPTRSFNFWRIVNTEDVVNTLPLPIFPSGQTLTYQHVDDYFLPGGARSNDKGIVSGFNFSNNLGGLHPNHNLVTYYAGLFDKNPSTPIN